MRTPALIVLGSLFARASCSPSIFQEIARIEREDAKLLQYPTSITQGIAAKMIHSHNDYWRDVPLLTAISFGVMSVEADVWLLNGTLFVGHELEALSSVRTLDSLYIAPLVKFIDTLNVPRPFTVNEPKPVGVFDTTGGTPMQVLVDIKTNGDEALPFVLKALEPLRKRGYLTTFANGTLTPSVVTIIGTGNSPLELIKKLEPRDYFYDAPLDRLSEPSNTTWGPELSPIASVDYETAVGWNGLNPISDAQRANITRMVQDAQSRRITSRFWDTPAWPVYARHNIWRELLQDGSSWLNADDLEDASSF